MRSSNFVFDEKEPEMIPNQGPTGQPSTTSQSNDLALPRGEIDACIITKRMQY